VKRIYGTGKVLIVDGSNEMLTKIIRSMWATEEFESSMEFVTGWGKRIYGTSALRPSACNCYLISKTLASFVYCYLM
jgi:hypothetical protein